MRSQPPVASPSQRTPHPHVPAPAETSHNGLCSHLTVALPQLRPATHLASLTTRQLLRAGPRLARPITATTPGLPEGPNAREKHGSGSSQEGRRVAAPPHERYTATTPGPAHHAASSSSEIRSSVVELGAQTTRDSHATHRSAHARNRNQLRRARTLGRQAPPPHGACVAQAARRARRSPLT